METASGVTPTRHPFAVRRTVLAIVFATAGLVLATVSSMGIASLGLGRWLGRVPAGCYELDHCGLSPWWAAALIFVALGLPAAAFGIVGWRVAARMSGAAVFRAALLLVIGTVAYHFGCQLLFVLVAYR
jgi:hypothetical protein